MDQFSNKNKQICHEPEHSKVMLTSLCITPTKFALFVCLFQNCNVLSIPSFS